MKFSNVDESANDSDSNEFSTDEELSENTPPVNKSNKAKRQYDDIPLDSHTLKKSRKNDLYKPPTVEELNNLQETENLFNNNLFRLQIDELLTETKIKNKRKEKLTSWLENFKASIQKLPEDQVLLSKLMTSKKRKTGKLLNTLIQYEPLFKTDQDVILHFLKPTNVQCFGLYENNCLPGPNLIININLTMPESCFSTKDYLNNRYIVRRYYYLLYVAEYLKVCDLALTAKIAFHENNSLLPVIDLTPKDSDKTRVVIFVSPEEGVFKPLRFSPMQNNLKVDLFKDGVDPEILKNTPTIFYNSLVAHDVNLFNNNQFLNDLLKDQVNVQDGIKLLMIWLNQRELNIGLGSFSETVLLYFIAYLLNKKKINKFMSSYQIIRNFWNFVTSTNLLKEGLHIGEASNDILRGFKEHNNVVLLDKSGCFNIASFLSSGYYKRIQSESQTALQYLDENKNTSFYELFLTKIPFYLQYDVIIDLTNSLPLDMNHLVTEEKKCIHIGYHHLLTCNYIIEILQKGLNKRASNIVPRIEMEEGAVKRFLVGITLNPDEAFNFLEMGPALKDFSDAQNFREFWGPLASDRRFRDGSMNVAVYFKTNTIKAKRNIIKKIISFLLEEKLQLKFKMHYDEFEDILLFKKLVPSYPSGGIEETSLKIILAADDLSNKLRELNMSLKITGVQGISDVFAYLDVVPPIPANFKELPDSTCISANNLIFSPNQNQEWSRVPRYVQPIESVLHLEHSSKWPNDLEALRHIKTSFYIEISKLLKTNHKLITHCTRDYLDIFFQGVVCRYRLYVPKEIALAKKKLTEDGLTSFEESEESSNLNISLNILPKVMGALRGVQALYPSYGPGTALIKRWLRSHLIDEYHISDMVINLLNASLYLTNSAWKPNIPQISFLRFLKFISEFDPSLQLVIVNFNNDLTSDVVSETESKVQANRKKYPNLFILTSFDDHSSVFTTHSPSKEILNRIKVLAQESLMLLDRILVNQDHIGVKELFIPNFDGYNVLIHLKPSMIAKRHQQMTFSRVESRTVVEKYKESEQDRIPIVDFDPINEYLCCLRTSYGKYAIFFHDSYGGSVIGVLWHPKVWEITDFKPATIDAGKLNNGKVVFDADAIIEDFFVIGKDVVHTIEKR